MPVDLPVGRIAQMACVAEVTAAKAGNVHPQASFADATWHDFITSAIVIRPHLEHAAARGLGAAVLACVQATRQAIGHNTNLGMILLLAPLCAVSRDESLDSGTTRVLASLTADDSRDIYRAIRDASPGGIGKVDSADVREEPTISLLDAMKLAAARDAVARQYVNNFADVLHRIAPTLIKDYRSGMSFDEAIVAAHLKQMAHEPDSLIARKCGIDVARESMRRAQSVLDTGDGFDELDAWLRADGHRRNPGTSADLVTAGIFAALRDGGIDIPFRWADSITDLSCAS